MVAYWFAVTTHPAAEWLAQQIVEAFPWDTAPRYLVRDNDAAYRASIQKPHQNNGDSRPPDSTEITPAKSIC